MKRGRTMLDLDALEKVAQEAKSRNDQSFGLDDFGDLLIGAGAVLALIADVKRLVIFHDHEKGRADDLEAERDALQAKLDLVRLYAKADYKCPCCTGYEIILDVLGGDAE